MLADPINCFTVSHLESLVEAVSTDTGNDVFQIHEAIVRLQRLLRIYGYPFRVVLVESSRTFVNVARMLDSYFYEDLLQVTTDLCGPDQPSIEEWDTTIVDDHFEDFQETSSDDTTDDDDDDNEAVMTMRHMNCVVLQTLEKTVL
ncbi:unnamed protein product [Sphagnum jensenii]